MTCLRAEYLKLCEQLSVDPEPKLERALKISNLSGCLSFQGDTTLSAISCQILAKIISTSDVLIKLDFANCMLPSTGFVDLISGLKKNKSVTELDLSSNNLQASSAVHIGTYLRFTKTLTRLFLQWNSLGQSKEAFCLLCEGIGVNKSLQELDLRNNALSELSTEDLSFAIKANKSLRTIDLRWNQLGPGDGRNLLNAVRCAPYLSCIQLDGNLFNADLILAIELAASHNGDIMQLAQEWESRCSILTNHSVQLEKKDEKRASGVRYLLQQHGQKINCLNKEQQNEIIRAEEQLKSNKKRMSTMESLILDKEEQIETLREMNKSMQEDKDLESSELGEQLGLLREQLTSAQTLIQQYKLKVQELEHEHRGIKLENSSLTDNMLLHNSKCEDVIRAAEERALSAIQKARSEKSLAEENIKQNQKNYEEKLKAMESLRADLEKRIQAQNLSHLQALETLRQQLADREAEKLSFVQSEKSELKSALDSYKVKVSTLHKELQEKKDEISKLNITVAELKQFVAKEQEKNSNLHEKLEDAAHRREEAERLRAQMALVQTELVSLRQEKDSQIKQLTGLLTNQERHLSELRIEEAERTGILCSAVSKYITKVGVIAGSPTDTK